MKKVLLSSVVALALLGGNVMAEEAKAAKAPSSQSVSASAVTHGKAAANAKRDDIKIVQEAVDAVRLTQEVLMTLSAKEVDKDKAIKTLEKAIGKLEVVMSNPKAPALIPLSSSVVVSEFPGTAYDVENAVITSIALLQNKRVQDARMIVQGLKDEIDLITINLPLASYPAALKLAAKYLHEDKVEEARRVIATALNTFVEVDVITPIGIIQAQELIVAAQMAAPKDKKLALAHLAAAKAALKKAEALGYTSISDTTYQMLTDAITEIEKEIRGKNKPEKLFEALIEKLREFKEKAVKSVSK